MTDKELFIDLLKRNGIPFDVVENIVIITVNHTTSKVVGYGGFETDWEFNPNGSLKKIGIWE